MEVTELPRTSCTLSCRMNCVAQRGALPGTAAALPQQRTVGVEPLSTGIEIGRGSSVTRDTLTGITVW